MMIYYILFILLALLIIWILTKPSHKYKTGIRFKATHPYGNEYVRLRVIYKGKFIRFNMVDINRCKSVDKCLGEFDGWLVRDHKHPRDSESIKIIHSNGITVGYVPHDYTGDRIRYDKKLPCECHCYIFRWNNEYWGVCVVAA